MEFKLGLVPSPPDKRDYLLSSFQPIITVEEIPVRYTELLDKQSSVQYQGNFGACAAFAGVAQKEYWDIKELETSVDLSEQFLYVEAKKRDGMPNVEGTNLRAILSAMLDVGICEEAFYPYEAKYPTTKQPKEGAFENAKKYKIKTYARAEVDKESFKKAIFLNGPVLVGVKIYTNFYGIGSDGLYDKISGTFDGGHALMGVAYDEYGPFFKNSWSTNWGNKGYCHLSWEAWETITYGEAWSIVDSVVEKKPWEDWPESELESAWLTKNSGILLGYSETEFKPWLNVTQHQAINIAKRLNFSIPSLNNEEKALSWSTPALRGWIHQNWPQYTFNEERWEELITRFQFALIIGRYLKDEGI